MTTPEELEEAKLKRITSRLGAALERLPPGYDGGIEMDVADLRTLLSAVDGDGWRAIETAPKDVPVLLFGPSPAGVWWGYWWVNGRGYMETSTGQDGWTDGTLRGEDLRVYEPTHWRPLPLAPRGRCKTDETPSPLVLACVLDSRCRACCG